MAPRHAVVLAALAVLLLLCGPGLVSALFDALVISFCRHAETTNPHLRSSLCTQVASRSLLEDCGKCNVPVDKGGCKCDANCACLPGKTAALRLALFFRNV